MSVAVSLILALVVLVALVVWLVHTVRNARSDETRPGMSLRRVLQYGFLFTAVCTAAVGLSRVLELALPGERLAGRGSAELAFGLSLSVVALPVSVGLWRVVRRRIIEDPDERASAAWALYLAVTATVAATVALVRLVAVGSWVAAAAPFSPAAAASGLVWGVVWVAHLRIIGHRRVSPTGAVADLIWLAGSAVGLIALAIGAGRVLFVTLDQLYGTLVGGVLVAHEPWLIVRRSAVVAVLGAGLWWWQWLRHAAGQPRTTLWHSYVLALPVLGGLLAAVGSAATILHAVLQWTLGVPDPDVAALHFAVVPGALSVGVMGTWAWGYHRAVLGEMAERRRTEPDRAYEYVGAAVGLLAASAGAAVAVVALIESLAPAPLATVDPTGRGVLVTAVTLLAVGGPLWWAFWRRLADPPAGAAEERSSPSRRAYLFLLFGAAGLTAVVSLMVALFEILQDVFEGTLDARVFLDVRIAVALTVTAGALSAYHWTVYREDRALRPEVERARYVLLVAADADSLAQGLRQATGATVRVLRRLDLASSDIESGKAGAASPDAVARAVLECPHPRVLVLVDVDDVQVVPYHSQ